MTELAKGKMLKAARVLLAAGTFAGFNLFMLGACAGFGWTAKMQLLPALAAGNLAVVVAIGASCAFFGRVFCSTVCPMGIFMDVADRLAPWRKRRRCGWRPARNGVRILAFAAACAAFAAGSMSLAAAFDGYSAYGRFAAHVLRPVWQAACNAVGGAMAEGGGAWLFREEIFARGAAALAAAAGGAAFAAACAAMGGRIFCNTVCPAGAMMGVLSRKPVFRIRVDAEKCVGCGLCEKACKANCLKAADGGADEERCVRCFNCLTVCRKGAIGWK